MTAPVASPQQPDSIVARLDRIWSDPAGISGFLSTVDHKRIGKRYLVTSLVFMVIAGIEAMLMRTQLAFPGNDVLSPQLYNQLMTMHGTTMIFLFNTPIWAGFGNYALPLQIGARDMAYPRLNALSYWIFLAAGVFIHTSFLVGAIPDGGWFAYVPLTGPEFSPGSAIDFWAIGLAFLGISTTIGAINFLVTTFKLRAPGMSISRLPIFVWGIVVMSVMILFAVPSVTLAQVLLALERSLGMAFFDASAGGDPLLYQHLFWFWGHPEVYIVFVPATAVVSMVVYTFSRTRLVGHLLVVAALVGIGFISFGVWAHHMFVTGLGFATLSFFAAASFVVSIPSGVQFFSWIATLWEGRARFRLPMLWALAMMLTFLLGGITGVMVAMIPFDTQATDTYFIVAHFHYVLMGGSVFPVFAGLFFWLPKMTGRMPHRRLGLWGFWTTFIAFHVTFFPHHVLGLWGMPRRVYTYGEGLGWGPLNLLSTVGAYALAVGVLLTLASLAVGWRRGRPAPEDPWGAATLEWAAPSPTPSYAFATLPRVTSRYPLWDQDRAELGGVGSVDGPVDGEGGTRPALVPPEGQEEHWTGATAGLEAAPATALPMPAPTLWPVLLAVAMSVVAYAVLMRGLAVFIAGVVAVAGCLVGWFWPAEEEPVEFTDGPDDAEEVMR